MLKTVSYLINYLYTPSKISNEIESSLELCSYIPVVINFIFCKPKSTNHIIHEYPLRTKARNPLKY